MTSLALPSTGLLALTPHGLGEGLSSSHFSTEETEAQREEVTCSKSHSLRSRAGTCPQVCLKERRFFTSAEGGDGRAQRTRSHGPTEHSHVHRPGPSASVPQSSQLSQSLHRSPHSLPTETDATWTVSSERSHRCPKSHTGSLFCEGMAVPRSLACPSSHKTSQLQRAFPADLSRAGRFYCDRLRTPAMPARHAGALGHEAASP